MFFVSEPFLESVPQVYVLLTLAFSSGGFYTNKPGILDINSNLFWVTASLSITAASFGIAKFLNSGPTRIVGNNKCLDGFGTLTFILIFCNVAVTLVGRGMVIGMEIAYIAYLGNNKFYNLQILLTFLPQFLHVSFKCTVACVAWNRWCIT